MMVGVNCQSESNFVRLNTFIGQNETERQQMKIEEAIKCAVGVVVIEGPLRDRNFFCKLRRL